jgi:predicted DNA-binding protein
MPKVTEQITENIILNDKDKQLLHSVIVEQNTKRMNLTLTDDTIKMIKTLAYIDNVSPTTKATEILKKGLELEEDTILLKIAEERLKELENGSSKLISHEEIWKDID